MSLRCRVVPPIFCDVNYRIKKSTTTTTPVPPTRTLADVLNGKKNHGADTVENMKIDDTTTSVTEFTNKTKLGAVGVGRGMKSFIISKGPEDRYFRSNPSWIAQYVVAKFRALLIRVKDEMTCIDMSMGMRNASTLPWKGHNMLSEGDLANFESQLLVKREDKLPVFAPESFRNIGAIGASASPNKMYKRSATRYMTKKKILAHRRRTAERHDLGDRRLMLRTLHRFPFEKLSPHSAGSMRFLEVVRYFRYEMHCDIVRHWKEGDTDHAEILLPSYSLCSSRTMWGHRDPTSPEAFDKKLRSKLATTTSSASVLEHWFGDHLAPNDPILGSIRTGTPNRGRVWEGISKLYSHLPRNLRPYMYKGETRYWSGRKDVGPETIAERQRSNLAKSR